MIFYPLKPEDDEEKKEKDEEEKEKDEEEKKGEREREGEGLISAFLVLPISGAVESPRP